MSMKCGDSTLYYRYQSIMLNRTLVTGGKLDLSIGGSGGRARRTLPKGPNSFVLTYKIFEM